jgi:hypothetical protein
MAIRLIGAGVLLGTLACAVPAQAQWAAYYPYAPQPVFYPRPYYLPPPVYMQPYYPPPAMYPPPPPPAYLPPRRAAVPRARPVPKPVRPVRAVPRPGAGRAPSTLPSTTSPFGAPASKPSPFAGPGRSLDVGPASMTVPSLVPAPASPPPPVPMTRPVIPDLPPFKGD